MLEIIIIIIVLFALYYVYKKKVEGFWDPYSIDLHKCISNKEWYWDQKHRQPYLYYLNY